MTTLERNIEDAARSAEDLRWFRGYLRGLLDAGVERELLEEVLKRVCLRFRKTGNEQAADLALDGLDLLTGWCGPGMEIPDPQTAT